MGRPVPISTGARDCYQADLGSPGNIPNASPLAMPQHAGLVMLSQALLSALAFGTSILFIAYSPKSEFGIYGMVYAAVLLSGGLQNAIILTPMTVTTPNLAGEERAEFVRRMAAAQGGICVLLAVLLGAATAAITVVAQRPASALAISSSIALIGAWCREFRRTERLLDGRFTRLLLGDAALVVLAGVALCMSVYVRWPLTAALGLCVTGLAGLLTGFPSSWSRLLSSIERSLVWQSLAKLRHQIRWTVPGVAVTWMQGNAYAYIVGAALGPTNVAEINTARAVIAPAALALTAWNRYQLPRIASFGCCDGASRILQHAKRARLWVVIGAAGYAALAIGLIDLFRSSPLMSKYARTGEFAMPWFAFLLFSGIRSTASIPLLARADFRQVFVFTTISALATIGTTVVLAYGYGALATVWAVAGGEVLLAYLCWWGLTRREEVPTVP